MGIPKDSVIQYENAIKANKFLLITRGSRDEVERARAVVGAGGGEVQVNVHSL
jgi:hypothetical protein